MPTWIFTGDAGRVFPERGVTLAPGEQLDAEQCPDPAFFTEAGGQDAAVKTTRRRAADPVAEPPAPVQAADE